MNYSASKHVEVINTLRVKLSGKSYILSLYVFTIKYHPALLKLKIFSCLPKIIVLSPDFYALETWSVIFWEKLTWGV